MSDWEFLHEMNERGYSPEEIADAAGGMNCVRQVSETRNQGCPNERPTSAHMATSALAIASASDFRLTTANVPELTPP